MEILVKKHKYNFKTIAQELGITEDQARKKWTQIYCAQKNKSLPANVLQIKKSKSSDSPSKKMIEEISASELMTSSRKKIDFLDHSDVDFTLQRSISITGEEITPSGYCVLKHSLKDTFQQMRDRVIEFLPDIDRDDDTEFSGCMDFKVGIHNNQAVFQSKITDDHYENEWKSEFPSVPLPNFDDIQVIPEDDMPKPKSSNTFQGSKSRELKNNEEIKEPSQKYQEDRKANVKTIMFKGRPITVAADKSDSEEEDSEEPWEEFVCVLKPCEKSRMIRSLLKLISENNISLKKGYFGSLSNQEIGRLYENDLRLGRSISFREYVEYFSGKSFVLHLHGEKSHENFTKVIGSINPTSASPQSFRGMYGETIENNKVYMSNTAQEAEEDISRLIDTYKIQYTPPHSTLTEHLCIVARVSYLENSFIYELFERLHSADLSVAYFRYDMFTKEVLDQYCMVGGREAFYNEFGENLAVIGAEGEDVCSKLIQLQEYSFTFLSKNPLDAINELDILINK